MKYTVRFRSRLIPSVNVTLRNQWNTFEILPEEDVAELLIEAEALKRIRSPVNQDEEIPNWLELPDDVISLIFTKLGLTEIIYRAQFVCCSWQKLSKQPHLFRSIDLRKPHVYCFNNFETVGNIAIDRSSGQLEEIYMENFATDDLLQKISDKSVSLNHICLVACKEISGDMLVELIRNSPSLEQLELINCYFSKEVIEVIGTCCSQLKKFRLDYFGDRDSLSTDNEEAFAIAKNMRGLRSLHLFGNQIRNEGLVAILDGCKHLEYLDIRYCFGIDFELDDEMEEKCVERVKHLRLPNDSMSDFEYDFDDYSYYGRLGYDGYSSYEESDILDNSDASGEKDNSDASGKKDKNADYSFYDEYEILKFLPAKAATCYF